MNNKQPFSTQDQIALELLLTLIVFFLLLFSTTQSKLLANQSSYIFTNDVELKLELSKSIISENSYIGINYQIINHSLVAINEYEIKSELHRFKSDNHIEIDVLPVNETNKKIVIPAGDTLFLHAETFVPFELATAWVISAGVEVEIADQLAYVGEGKIVYGFGINMDINAEEECIGINELKDIELISRLLIDEDAAKDPGVTIITVGGIDIEIELPETQWEARNIMISCSDLNANVLFDPFDLPPDVPLEILCDQGNDDLGRNMENVLDECEPIETFRDLCSAMGEDDVLCEFPEWVFCYELRLPDGYSEDTYTIDATDDYEVWQALENPAGSGNFDPFVDVTNDISSGNSDQVVLSVKTVLPVNLINSEIELRNDEVLFSWQTSSEINNSHYEVFKSNDGYEFIKLTEVLASKINTQVNSYEMIDTKPFDGDNYYKLIQKDLNGQTNYLITKHIEVNKELISTRIFPNPVTSRIYVEQNDQFSQYEIYDLNHHLISKGVLENNSISISNTSPGIYLLKLSNADHSNHYSERIIVSP